MNIDDTNGPKMPKVDVDWGAGGDVAFCPPLPKTEGVIVSVGVPNVKLCPFCGGSNILAEADEVCCPVEYFGQARCSDCDALGPLAEYKYDTVEEAKTCAFEAWNKRADQLTALKSENARLMDALRRIHDGYGPNHLSKYARDVAGDALSPPHLPTCNPTAL